MRVGYQKVILQHHLEGVGFWRDTRVGNEDLRRRWDTSAQQMRKALCYGEALQGKRSPHDLNWRCDFLGRT